MFVYKFVMSQNKFISEYSITIIKYYAHVTSPEL